MKKENNNKAYSPYSFKDALGEENPLFQGIAANDSKDSINFLFKNNNINNINNDINSVDQTNENLMLKSFLEEFVNKFNSPISNLFYGIMETKSHYLSCNIIRYNFQVFSFLEFPLQHVNT